MNIEFKKIEEPLKPRYGLGDLFQEPVTKEFYFLTQSKTVFLLASIRGNDSFSESTSLPIMKNDIEEFIEKGELVHFPQGVFNLILEKI